VGFLDMVPMEIHKERHFPRKNWLGTSAGKVV
jgi:hypothetical protein